MLRGVQALLLLALVREINIGIPLVKRGCAICLATSRLQIYKYITSNQRAVCPVVVDVIPLPLATMDALKPIAFCEHLQLSSLGVQPASISFQVR